MAQSGRLVGSRFQLSLVSHLFRILLKAFPPNGRRKRKRKRRKSEEKEEPRRKALTSVPGLMSVFTELHSKTVATEGGVDGRSMRPASDSTARNALTSEALQDPLIPEHHGQKTCRVGLAGIHPASRPGFYGIRTEREKNGIKDVILRISFRHRLSLY